jgi:hypothetical protein
MKKNMKIEREEGKSLWLKMMVRTFISSFWLSCNKYWVLIPTIDGLGYDDHGDEDLENDESEEEDFDDIEEAEVDGPRRSKRGMLILTYDVLHKVRLSYRISYCMPLVLRAISSIFFNKYN